MPSHDDALFDLIAQEALIDRAKLTRTATLTDLGIDSVDVVTVVFAVEEKYAIEVPQNAFDNVANLGDLADIFGALIEQKDQVRAQ
jgi:acyl carrier protein